MVDADQIIDDVVQQRPEIDIEHQNEVNQIRYEVAQQRPALNIEYQNEVNDEDARSEFIWRGDFSNHSDDTISIISMSNIAGSPPVISNEMLWNAGIHLFISHLLA